MRLFTAKKIKRQFEAGTDKTRKKLLSTKKTHCIKHTTGLQSVFSFSILRATLQSKFRGHSFPKCKRAAVPQMYPKLLTRQSTFNRDINGIFTLRLKTVEIVVFSFETNDNYHSFLPRWFCGVTLGLGWAYEVVG